MLQRFLSALFFLSGAARRRPELAGAVTPAERQKGGHGGGGGGRTDADTKAASVTAAGLYLCLFVWVPCCKSRFFLNSPSVESGLGN